MGSPNLRKRSREEETDVADRLGENRPKRLHSQPVTVEPPSWPTIDPILSPQTDSDSIFLNLPPPFLYESGSVLDQQQLPRSFCNMTDDEDLDSFNCWAGPGPAINRLSGYSEYLDLVPDYYQSSSMLQLPPTPPPFSPHSDDVIMGHAYNQLDCMTSFTTPSRNNNIPSVTYHVDEEDISIVAQEEEEREETDSYPPSATAPQLQFSTADLTRRSSGRKVSHARSRQTLSGASNWSWRSETPPTTIGYAEENDNCQLDTPNTLSYVMIS